MPFKLIVFIDSGYDLDIIMLITSFIALFSVLATLCQYVPNYIGLSYTEIIRGTLTI